MKISAKYEKELKKFFELSKKFYIVNFQLRNEELISNFSGVTDEEKIDMIKEGIKQACYKKNSDEIAYLMYSIWIFGLFPKYSLNYQERNFMKNMKTLLVIFKVYIYLKQ